MLKVPAPFPQVGSFALMVDDLMPVDMHRAELVRIQHRGDGATVHITWPMRIGASGFRVVDEAQLIDATPLTKAEEREMHDAARHLSGREHLSKKQGEQKARGEALRQRHIMSEVMAIEQRKLGRLQARRQPSNGSHLPTDIAA